MSAEEKNYEMKSYPPMPFVEAAFAHVEELPPGDVIAHTYEAESHVGWTGTIAISIALNILSVLGMRYHQSLNKDVPVQVQNAKSPKTVAQLK